MDDAYKTHDYFFHIITPKKLNELLYRADERTKYLETHINNNLTDAKCIVKIKSHTTYCDIYIEFFDLKRYKIGHVSFHITSENKGIKRENGRFHAKNNKKPFTYTLKFQKFKRAKNFNEYLIMYFNSKINSNEFENCLKTTLTILNEYFNPDSKLYLKHKMTELSEQLKLHPCLEKIENQMKSKFKTKLQKTRSVHPALKSHSYKSKT
jgi:hypothetical protein